ncbi:YafY family transcriptional regulator [Egibacter rhizosphaerae]|uniref:YafY family transcriptional regulator n=1 Tax=Egibacter rhizosphaerae TaxID=1670831 RepID=A0A411YEE4_9ACTN|nr:YafY family protein [Egibacter rhizosphaerae]QBI19560.1 YafY family transcriptional regulator [Egibacter rhizosphaerae]
MDTLARVLQLLALLQQQPTWTSDALAERLGVTPRTVRRDIARLRDLGYVVDAEPGQHGGYRLAGGRAVPPLALADDEAVAAAVALRGGAGSGVVGAEEAGVTALAKLEQVLPPRLREQVRSLETATELLQHGSDAHVEPSTLVGLAHACRARERVRCAYTDRAGTPGSRDLEPYRLVRARGRWYLVAFDRGRDAWRTFRVDRVRSVQPQGVPAEPRPLPDAAALVATAISVAPYPWHARVRLHAPLSEVAVKVPPTVGTLSADGDASLLDIGADDLEWLAHYLLGLQVAFEVLRPDELRAVLADVGRRLVTEFGSDGAPSG